MPSGGQEDRKETGSGAEGQAAEETQRVWQSGAGPGGQAKRGHELRQAEGRGRAHTGKGEEGKGAHLT